jgi:RHS repeat-associated protein
MLNHKIKITPRAHRAPDCLTEAANDANCTTAPYTILHDVQGGTSAASAGRAGAANGVTNVANINQRLNGGKWVSLGQHDFAVTTTGGTQYIELTNQNGRVTADAIKLVYIPAITAPVTQTNVYYIHNDHLGTPRAMTDASKKVVWRWDADPFGNTAANDDPDNDGIKVTMNLRFAGQYFDQESGLHYNYHRYYDPLTGRYVTSDPIGLDGGLNTFGYVGGNPTRFHDYYGLAFGDLPPKPPGYNPETWPYQGTNSAGRPMMRDPDGKLYIGHPEDKNHWRHWDINNGGNDQDRWPPNSKKPQENRKRPLNDEQSSTDPNGDESSWCPPNKENDPDRRMIDEGGNYLIQDKNGNWVQTGKNIDDLLLLPSLHERMRPGMRIGSPGDIIIRMPPVFVP